MAQDPVYTHQQHQQRQQEQHHDKSTMDKVKEKFDVMNPFGSGKPLHRLLKRADDTLSRFFKHDKDMDSNKMFPMELLRDCRGILFLSCDKHKELNAKDGNGFIMANLMNQRWSGPCSVGLLNDKHFGGEHTDFFVVFRSEKPLNLFLSKGELRFDQHLRIKEGPLGQNLNNLGDFDAFSYGILNNKELKGVNLDGQGFVVKPECNEKCYGSKLGRKKILENHPEKDVFGKHFDNFVKLLTGSDVHGYDLNMKDKDCPKVDKVIDNQQKDLDHDTVKQKGKMEDELLHKKDDLNMKDKDHFGKDIHVKDFKK